MTNYKIIITQRAISNLTECVLFVKHISKEAAKKLYEEIMASINSLETFPKSYSCFEGLTIRGHNVRRMPISNGRYLILYIIEKEKVVIYDVIDVRKEPYVLKV